MTVAVCDIDGKTFQHASSYSYKKVHSTTDISCNECSSRFTSLKTFDIHQKSHASSLRCANETNKFSDIFDKFVHDRSNEMFSCGICNNSFNTKNLMMIKKVENKLRAKKSVICDKRFLHKGGMKIHSRAHHI